ncbi:Solute carrier family 25 member 36-like protein, partial [Dinothrombium tinctorium]
EYGTATLRKCSVAIWRENRWKGFFKGLSASYFGVSDTVIHFVIYEHLKMKINEHRLSYNGEVKVAEAYGCHNTSQFVLYFCAAAVSKTCSTLITYPHEVIRTRLREQGNKYKTFRQTFGLILREERMIGLYRGLGTQCFRQIPNTAIMMGLYEIIVYSIKSLQTSHNTL